MYRVIGVRETGLRTTIKGHSEYDNIYLHIVTDADSRNNIGLTVNELEVRRATATLYGVDKWSDLLGCEIAIAGTPFERDILVTGIHVIEKPKEDPQIILQKIKDALCNPEE